MIDREQVVEALAEMTADERRDILAEASGQAKDPKIRAAQAFRTYLPFDPVRRSTGRMAAG